MRSIRRLESCAVRSRSLERKPSQAIYLEKDVSETDDYGRLLRYVFLTDGRFVSEEMVRSGYTESIEYPPDVRLQHVFEAGEAQAQAAGVGRWLIRTILDNRGGLTRVGAVAAHLAARSSGAPATAPPPRRLCIGRSAALTPAPARVQ